MDRMADSKHEAPATARAWGQEEFASEILIASPEDWICHIESRTAADGRTFLSSAFTRLCPTPTEVWKLSINRNRFDSTEQPTLLTRVEESFQVVVQQVHPPGEPKCLAVGDRARELFLLTKERTRDLLIGEAVYNPVLFEIDPPTAPGSSSSPQANFLELQTAIRELSVADWNLAIIELGGGGQSRCELRFVARTGVFEITLTEELPPAGPTRPSAPAPMVQRLQLKDREGNEVAHSLNSVDVERLLIAAHERIKSAGLHRRP